MAARKDAAKNDPIAKDAPASSQSQAESVDETSSEWPAPGQEGFVHNDGTPQARAQLEDNKQAAADRAAAGSIIHGAPLAVPGPDPEGETAKAIARAEDA